MKIFGKYFAYRAKRSLGRFVIIAVLSLIYLVPVLTEEYVFSEYETFAQFDRRVGSLLADKLNTITFITCALCTIIPILEFASLHNRKNADTMFSMAISRSKIALVHFLNGAWQIVALVSCYTLMYANVVLKSAEEYHELTSVSQSYDMTLFIPYYFATLLGCIFLYSFFALVFNFANNVTDGVVFSIAYIFAGYILMEGIKNLFSDWFYDSWLVQNSFTAMPYSFTVNFASDFFDALRSSRNMELNGGIFKDMPYPVIISAVGALVFISCLLWLFARKKAEKIEGISSSPFGYALLIPIYGISYSAIIFSYKGVSVFTTSSAFIIIAMVVGYMIYRRSFKLKILDFIMIALALAMMFAAYPIKQMFELQ